MKRLKDYDAMKGVAILLVIFGHVTRMFAPQGIVPITYSQFFTVATNFIYIFHMPAFVAITGAMYYYGKRDRGKYRNNKLFTLDKVKRLLIPFLFFSLVVVFPVLHYIGLRESLLLFIIDEIVLGMAGSHLWYSVMIFFVFVVFNLFEEKIYKNNPLINWGILTVLYFASFVAPPEFQIDDMMRYLIYFYAGYWFQGNRDLIYTTVKKHFITAMLITVGVYLINYHTPIQNSSILRTAFNLIGGLSGTLLLYTISDTISEMKIMDNSFFKETIKSSYGLYLFHPMIIYLISFWEQGLNVNSFLLVVVNFIMALLVSIIMIKIMRSLNLQIFIGETTRRKEMIKTEKII